MATPTPKDKLELSEQERIEELIRENRRLSRDVAEHRSVVKSLRESEACLRSLFEDVTEGIVIADVASKRFLRANSAFCRMLGYSQEEITAIGVKDVHPAASLQKVLNEFGALADGNKVVAVDVPCLRKDGTLLYADIAGSAMRIDGKDCLVGHFIDVTDRKLAADAARKREEEFKAIADYTYDWECWIAPDGSLLWVNPAVEKITGYSSREWLRKPYFLSRIIPREDRAHVRNLIEKGLRERSSGNHIPFRVQHRDGGVRWVAISYQPIYDGQGEFLGLRTSARDITASKHIEEQILGLGVLKERLVEEQSLNAKLKLVTDEIVAIFGADFARIWLIEAGDLCARGCLYAQGGAGANVCQCRDRCLHLMASSGRYTAINGSHRRVPLGCHAMGRVASGEEARFISNDVPRDPRVHDPEWARSLGLTAFAGFRLASAEGKPVGVLVLFSKQAITPVEEGLLVNLANSVSQVILADRARESLLKSEERYRSLFEHANDAILLLQEDRLVDCNPKALQMFQCSREQIVGRSLFFFSPALQPDGQPSQVEIQEKISATLMGVPQSFEGKLCRQDGTPFDVEVSLSLINVDHEWLIQAIIRDVTERKLLMEELYRLSVIDDLTGLYNRRGFLTLAEQQLKVAARSRQRLVLFFFDLDHLKKVNDTLGHQEGDVMLEEIAAVLRQTFRKSDIIGRMGGDEFAVLVLDAESGVSTSIARLSTVLEACNRKEERKNPLSLSLGFALFDPEDPCSLDELIARADNRMYQDKYSKRQREDLSSTAPR